MLTIDEIQIRRWLAFKRHAGALSSAAKKANRIGDPSFRPKQRQALLQWAWNPFIDRILHKINVFQSPGRSIVRNH